MYTFTVSHDFQMRGGQTQTPENHIKSLKGLSNKLEPLDSLGRQM
jgi:hypothetical protein